MVVLVWFGSWADDVPCHLYGNVSRARSLVALLLRLQGDAGAAQPDVLELVPGPRLDVGHAVPRGHRSRHRQLDGRLVVGDGRAVLGDAVRCVRVLIARLGQSPGHGRTSLLSQAELVLGAAASFDEWPPPHIMSALLSREHVRRMNLDPIIAITTADTSNSSLLLSCNDEFGVSSVVMAASAFHPTDATILLLAVVSLKLFQRAWFALLQSCRNVVTHLMRDGSFVRFQRRQ